MAERTDANRLEHDDRQYEDENEVFEEIKKRYQIKTKKDYEDKALARSIAVEIQERSGIKSARNSGAVGH